MWEKLTPFFFRLRLVADDDADVDSTCALSESDTGVLTMTSCKLDGRVSNLQSLLQRRRGK